MSRQEETIPAGIMGNNDSINQGAAEIVSSKSDCLNLNMVTNQSLELWGNSLLGQIANAQAALNHTNLLDTDTMFIMSDVVDAVNYKNGDATPVLDGLMKKMANHLAGGGMLADSPATGRIMPRLTRYWIDECYENDHGQMPDLLDNMDWIINTTGAMDNALTEMDDRLRYRMLRANGPVSGLLDICDQAAYRTVNIFDASRRSRWANFMQERGKAWTLMNRSNTPPGAMYKLQQQFDDEWRAKSRKVQEALILEFLRTARDYINEKDDFHVNGMFLNAYQQVEAVKSSRWSSGRPLNLQPVLDMIISERDDMIAEADAWSNQPGVDDTLLVRTTGAVGSAEAGSPRGLLWSTHGDILEWDGNMLGPFIIQDRFSANMLNVAKATGENLWQYAGIVGGDSNVLVLIAAS